MEMHDRYHLLAANGARNIQEFNKRVMEGASLQLPKNPDVAFEDRTYRAGIQPYIVIVIDELADLMMTVQGEVETPLAMLAQKARAIGIHIILATQRPSVNVITGLIKANFPSRIAFRVASQVDSRTIIDGIGAEALLGNGDMLFIPPGKSEPQRIQGAFIPGDDTERLMAWFDDRRTARRAALAAKGLAAEGADEADILQVVRDREALEAEPDEDDTVPAGKRDPEFRRAAEVCIQHQLDRRHSCSGGSGSATAAPRIIDQLHAAGVLGPPNGPNRATSSWDWTSWIGSWTGVITRCDARVRAVRVRGYEGGRGRRTLAPFHPCTLRQIATHCAQMVTNFRRAPIASPP
jgi:S-DNA-T family DNA segregation ATPase FtsK/SpoIIIE